MITLLVYLLVFCLVIWLVRLVLPLTGLPENAILAVCVILAIIMLLWLLSSLGGASLSAPRLTR